MTEIGGETEPFVAAPPVTEIKPAMRVIAIIAVVSLISGVIAAACNGYWMSNFTQSYCMALTLLGCALLYGQLGLVSLCQWALVGVGGWVSLRVYHSFHPPFLLTVLAGGVGASVIGGAATNGSVSPPISVILGLRRPGPRQPPSGTAAPRCKGRRCGSWQRSERR